MRPQVLIDQDLWRKVLGVVKKAQVEFGECSWLGIGTIGADEEVPTYYINRVVFPEQENDRGNSEMDDAGIAAVLATMEEDERILWWGHSHGDGQTFFSATDWDTWNKWMEHKPPFFLATVHTTKTEAFHTVVHVQGHCFELGTGCGLIWLLNMDPDGFIADAVKNMKKPFSTYGAAMTPLYNKEDIWVGQRLAPDGTAYLKPHHGQVYLDECAARLKSNPSTGLTQSQEAAYERLLEDKALRRGVFAPKQGRPSRAPVGKRGKRGAAK